MNLEEVGIYMKNWDDSAQGRDYWAALANAELNLRVSKCMELVIIIRLVYSMCKEQPLIEIQEFAISLVTARVYHGPLAREPSQPPCSEVFLSFPDMMRGNDFLELIFTVGICVSTQNALCVTVIK